MKNMVVSLAMILSSTSALASTDYYKVCSEMRNGQVTVLEFEVLNERQANIISDGYSMPYEIVRKNAVSLNTLTKIAGERVIEATEYTLRDDMGTRPMTFARGVSGDHLIFRDISLLGASGNLCRGPAPIPQ